MAVGIDTCMLQYLLHGGISQAWHESNSAREADSHQNIGKGGHIVLKHAELVHVIFSHNVWSAGKHLPQFDEGRP